MTDFSFKGVHISRYGLNYVPDTDKQDIWDSDYDAFSDSVDSQDGAHWHGSKTNEKEFELRCYFEQITPQQMGAIQGLFGKDSFGEQIFDERRWLTYEARVTERPKIEKYPSPKNTFSGIITQKLKAFYPFAVSDIQTLSDLDQPSVIEDLLAYTGITESLPEVPTVPMTAQTTAWYYNGGNAPADTVLRISGDVGDGVTIYNMDTDQTCKLINLTSAISSGKYLEIRSRTGECVLTDGVNTPPGYQYHDNSYITLRSSCPIKRNIAVDVTSNVVTSNIPVFDAGDVGSFLYLGTWKRITEYLTPERVEIESIMADGRYVVDVLKMNRLVITPVSTMNLTKFDVIYKHTFQ